MTLPGGSGSQEEALRQEASDWFAIMRGPDAAKRQLEFERWRTTDPRRRVAYARLEERWRATAALAATATGRARNLPPPRPPLFALNRPRTAFALGILAISVMLAILIMAAPGRGVATRAVQSETVATSVGEIRRVRLADGSAVTLDTDSAISVALSGTARSIVLLRGRARFAVAHDATRPFAVTAADAQVVALGTMFDVALDREGVKVSLFRGAVDVRALRSAADAPALARLAPGQVFARAATGRPRLMPAPRGADQWVRGMLNYENAPLSQVVEDANRYSAQKLRLADTDLGSMRVTGVFPATPIARLAKTLARTFGLRVDRSPTGNLVLKRR